MLAGEIESLSISMIAIGSLVLWLFLRSYEGDPKTRLALYLSHLFRVGALWWDRYCGHIFMLPNMGQDTDDFHAGAMLILSSPDYLQSTSFDPYTRFIGSLYRVFGPQRMCVQYLNVVLSIATILLTITTLRELRVKETIIMKIVLIAAFFPQGIILSSLLLRESIIIYFFTASVSWYVRWYNGRGWLCAIVSLASLLCASFFHAGVIAILLVYAFMFTFYHPRHGSFRISYMALGVLALSVVGIVVSVFNNGVAALFLDKFLSQDMFEKMNHSAGGSVYLTGLTIDSIDDIVVSAPLRVLYFWLSPLPWSWRGPQDAMMFCLDSLVYLIAGVIAMVGLRHMIRDRALAFQLLVMVTVVALLFALGTSNAGTAARHRNKVMLLLMSVVALIVDRSIHPSLVPKPSPVGGQLDRTITSDRALP